MEWSFTTCLDSAYGSGMQKARPAEQRDGLL